MDGWMHVGTADVVGERKGGVWREGAYLLVFRTGSRVLTPSNDEINITFRTAHAALRPSTRSSKARTVALGLTWSLRTLRNKSVAPTATTSSHAASALV
jgi:hypothetical protein